MGRARSLCLDISDTNLLSDLDGIINPDAKVAHGAVNSMSCWTIYRPRREQSFVDLVCLIKWPDLPQNGPVLDRQWEQITNCVLALLRDKIRHGHQFRSHWIKRVPREVMQDAKDQRPCSFERTFKPYRPGSRPLESTSCRSVCETSRRHDGDHRHCFRR